METLRCAGFEIEHDAARTRAAWSHVARGAAEACGCATCAAYLAVRAEALDEATRALLVGLGLDPERESELAPLGPGPQARSLRVVAAWAFAGVVRARPDEPGVLRFDERPHRAPAGLLGGPLAVVELELCLAGPPPERWSER